MSVYQNINGTLARMDASDLVQLAAVDTEGILGGTPGATTNGQTLVDQLAADDVQAQTDIGQIKTDLLDYLPRSEQRVLGSKNLLPITATSQTVSGITWTVYRDSRGRVTSIVANGTATARSNLSTDVVVEQEHLNQYGQQRYILSGCPSGGSASTYYLYLHPGKTNGSWNPAVADVGNGVSFEYDGQTKIFCACTIMSGVTVSNLVYKPMIRLASDPDDTYVPYAMTNMELTEGNIKYPVKLTSSNNINDIKTPGFYYWGDSLPTNLPGTLYYSSMSVQRLWTDGKIIQIIQRNGEMYTHAWTGSAWNGWYKFTGTAV